jgi:hypothetical protein
MKSKMLTLSVLLAFWCQITTAQTCPNNLLINPGFENNLSSWEGSGVISTVASAGAQSVKLCQSGNLRQTNATTSGKNLSLSFKARTETTGANTVLAYIKYLNSSWSPLVTEFYSFNTTATYAQGTVSKAAPTGTAWVEVGFLKSNAGCVLIDEICLSEGGGSSNCSTDLGAGDLLCTEKLGTNLVVRKILNGSVTATTVSGAGAIVSSVNEGPLVQDSVLVTGNQVRKKLVNGTIAWTRTIPQSILDSLNTVQAAAELSNGQLLLGGFRKPANGGLPPSVGILTLVKTTSAVVPITFQRLNTNTSFQDPNTGFFDRFLLINPRADGGADVVFTNMFPGIINFESLNITRVNSALTVTIPTISVAVHAGFFPAATSKIYRSTCGSYFFDLPIYTAAQKGTSTGRQRLYHQQSDLKLVSKYEGGTGNVDQFGNFNFSKFSAASPDSLTGEYLYRPGVDPVPPFRFRLVNSPTDTVIVQTPIDAYVHAARIGAGLFLFSKNANGSLVVNIPTNCGATLTCSPDVTPPVIVNCPPSQNVPTTGTNATVSFTMPTATDACSAATLTTSAPPNAAIYPLGTTTVNINATDAANNVATCTFTITVTSAQQGGCSNNLLQNGGFESNFTNWEGTGGVISTTAATGIKSAKLCQNMSLRQTLATASGKTLTLTFKARGEATATNVVAYIKYLNSAWSPLVTEFLGYAAGTSFGQGTVSKLAPTGTAYVEIGFLQNAASCVLIDEVCLTDGVVPPACALTSVSGPVVCDNANTPTNPADDTFSGSITVSNTGNCGVGWTSNATPASGSFGTTVGFGPYLISGGNKTITFAAAGDPSKTTSITLIAPSTCSNAVPVPDIVSKNCLDFVGFSNGTNLGVGTVAAGGTVTFQSCTQTVNNLIAPNTSITFKNKIYISPANFLNADAILITEETITTNLTSSCGQNCFFSASPYATGNIPSGLTPGTYFMISVSDADVQIAESSETNNVYVQSVNVVSAPQPSGCTGNLLTNGNFDQGMTGWSGNFLIDPDNSQCQFTTQHALVQNANKTISQSKPATPGRSYTLKVVADDDMNASSISGLVGMRFKNGNIVLDSIVAKDNSSLPGISWIDFPFVQAGCTARDITLTKIAPAGTTSVEVFGQFLGQFQSAIWNQYLFDDFCLTEQANAPDLTTNNLILLPGATAARGSVYSFNFRLLNVGNATAQGNYSIKSYLSTDTNLSADDLQDGIIPTGNLIPTGLTGVPVTGALTIPATTPLGSYYILLFVDSENTISESNEQNNVVASTGTLTVTAGGGGSGADLNITMTADKTTVPQWNTVSYTITAKNEGTSPITNAVIKVGGCTGTGTVTNFDQAFKLVYAGAIAQPTVGSYNGVAQEWTLNNLAAGQTATYTINLFATGTTEKKVIAFAKSQAPTDSDSQPNANAPTNCNPAQDDEAVWTINAGQALVLGNSMQQSSTDAQAENGFFPNPASDAVYLQFAPQQMAEVVIMNHLGKIVATKKWESTNEMEQLDTSELQNGHYFLRIAVQGERAHTYGLVIARGY